MSFVTNNIARYVKDKGFNISKISRETGIPYSALYSSLCDEERKRSLRDDEFVAICRFLCINPMDFTDNPDKKKEVV